MGRDQVAELNVDRRVATAPYRCSRIRYHDRVAKRVARDYKTAVEIDHVLRHIEFGRQEQRVGVGGGVVDGIGVIGEVARGDRRRVGERAGGAGQRLGDDRVDRGAADGQVDVFTDRAGARSGAR